MEFRDILRSLDQLDEATKEVKGGRVHTAEPGGYGRQDDEDEAEDGKKIKTDKPAGEKRGRGRPPKEVSTRTSTGADTDNKKYSSDSLQKAMGIGKPSGKAKVTTKHKTSDKEPVGESMSLKGWFDKLDKELVNEAGLAVQPIPASPQQKQQQQMATKQAFLIKDPANPTASTITTSDPAVIAAAKNGTLSMQKPGAAPTTGAVPATGAGSQVAPMKEEGDKWIQGAVKHPGAFTKKAKSHGMTAKEFANKVLANKKDYPANTEKQAQLAKTLGKMHEAETPQNFAQASPFSGGGRSNTTLESKGEYAMKNKQGVAEGKTIASGLNDWQKKALKHDTYEKYVSHCNRYDYPHMDKRAWQRYKNAFDNMGTQGVAEGKETIKGFSAWKEKAVARGFKVEKVGKDQWRAINPKTGSSKGTFITTGIPGSGSLYGNDNSGTPAGHGDLYVKEQGVAEAKSPEEFLGQIRKMAAPVATKQSQVGSKFDEIYDRVEVALMSSGVVTDDLEYDIERALKSLKIKLTPSLIDKLVQELHNRGSQALDHYDDPWGDKGVAEGLKQTLRKFDPTIKARIRDKSQDQTNQGLDTIQHLADLDLTSDDMVSRAMKPNTYFKNAERYAKLANKGVAEGSGVDKAMLNKLLSTHKYEKVLAITKQEYPQLYSLLKQELGNAVKHWKILNKATQKMNTIPLPDNKTLDHLEAVCRDNQDMAEFYVHQAMKLLNGSATGPEYGLREGMEHNLKAAYHEGKSHGLAKQAYSCRHDDMEEARMYHEGYKQGLDECYGQIPIRGLVGEMGPGSEEVVDDMASFGADTPELDEVSRGEWITQQARKPGDTFKAFGQTMHDSDVLDEFAFESLDSKLSAILEGEEVAEGMTVSISKGQQGAPDSVSVSAQDGEADQLLSIIKSAGLGLFGGEEKAGYGAPQGSTQAPGGIEVVDDHDGMMALMKKLTGQDIGAESSSDYEDEEGHEGHSHEEGSCNECGYMESQCKCDKEVVDEVESEDQQEFEVAEANAPDSGADNTDADVAGNAATNSALATDDAGADEEEGQVYSSPVSEESDAEEDDKAEEAGEEVTKDIEYDEYHTGKDDDGAEEAGEEVKKDIEYDDKKDDEKDKVDESYANSADDTFEADIDFMTNIISGGLNKRKQTGQTTIPVVASQLNRTVSIGVTDVNESRMITESVNDWKKLAGIQ